MNPGISILNDVLGPVMRGPSSSHTAASCQLGRLAVSLFGQRPSLVVVAFDPSSSYGRVYRQQGVDLGFAMGLLDLPITDRTFFRALETAADSGIDLRFEIRRLANPDHPNTAEIEVTAGGRRLKLRCRSVGGGAVEISTIDAWPVLVTGQTHEVLAELNPSGADRVRALLASDGNLVSDPAVQIRGALMLLHARRKAALSSQTLSSILDVREIQRLWQVPPIAFVKKGRPLFVSAAEMVAQGAARGCSLGRLALAHESLILEMTQQEVSAEMALRVERMLAAIREGLGDSPPTMRLLSPSAGAIFRAEKEGRLAIGGIHARAAAEPWQSCTSIAAWELFAPHPREGPPACFLPFSRPFRKSGH